jgi:hypothetical protein
MIGLERTFEEKYGRLQVTGTTETTFDDLFGLEGLSISPKRFSIGSGVVSCNKYL